jgi:hypothetical protein
MIIREWTDPENSMHPGLDWWREAMASVPGPVIPAFTGPRR